MTTTPTTLDAGALEAAAEAAGNEHEAILRALGYGGARINISVTNHRILSAAIAAYLAARPAPAVEAVEAEVRDWMRRSGEHLARAQAAESAITAARLAEAEEILAGIKGLEKVEVRDFIRARIAALKAAAAGEERKP